MTRHVFDLTASSLRIRTRASGLLARLAHDLELRATVLEGSVEEEPGSWTTDLRAAVSGLRVAGTLHGDRLDPAALSASDRAEIERKLRDEVLRVAEVRVRATGRDRASAEVQVIAARTAQTRASLSVREVAAGELQVVAALPLSLRALGVAEVKGPLGAFKVDDTVQVLVDLRLRPA
ncbi:MAG: hypothetical protein WKG00_39045 [Polyangiaceae bacterium]